ncbi:hypothetical protein NM688_g1850 [Phlebia brevispora]|uniref:Uncharacterized protein n=1 Tax=Phlebia brevispora TaxID=194682 RepID=A0ACC1TAM6_9APHY|nr:hypothetical protein NM688_g1850 [Phlebia brevispora]
MWSHSLLPRSLLALLFAFPVFSSPTTPFDPFHDIAVHVSKPPELPVCCLKPLAPLDNVEEEGLLSFEEWKARQLSSVQQEQAAASQPPLSPGNKSGQISAGGSPEENPSLSVGAGAATVSLEQTDAPPPNAPYFRIPLTDRFNYASMDCSARVHTAHRSAKSVSSILSSKKDKYMLSPCAEKNQFIIVELCDDIRIDTVQLANYEFFSGVFKDFTVHVAKTYTTDTDGWTYAGTYKGRNTRGVQVSAKLHRTSRRVEALPAVVPSPDHAYRLLSLHSHRLPFALRKRILLSVVPIASLWTHTSRALEVGPLGSGE